MGLGKTIQMIALVLSKKIEKREQAIANGEPIVDSDEDDFEMDWDSPKDRRGEIFIFYLYSFLLNI